MDIQVIIYNVLRYILEMGFREQKQIIKDKLLNNKSPGIKILDLGCGTGMYAALFDRESYIGLEIDPAYIRYAKRHKKRNFVRGDACRLPFKSGVFGLLYSIAVFHHLPREDILAILKETRRVLGDSSLFLLIDQVNIRANVFIDWLFRFIRRFDKGKFIRTPEDNLEILAKEPDFDIIDNWTFRNGLFTYQGILMKIK